MADKEDHLIFVASITLRNGKRIYASQFGKKAFPIRVKPKPPTQPMLPGIK